MKRLLVAVLATMMLAACNPGAILSSGALPAPSSVADTTKVDEQTGLAVTLAYTAAAKAAKLAIQTGLIKSPATMARVAALDTRAYHAVQAVRSAYLAGNATSIAAALAQANGAVSDLLSATKGN